MTSFRFNPRFSAVAFTGADVGGKSTAMQLVKEYVDSLGMTGIILAEGASELISAGFHPVENWRENKSFQEFLLEYLLYRENLYYEMMLEQDTENHLVLLCDRGALDAIAYVGRKGFSKIASSFDSHIHHLRERYRAVIHLVTTAHGKEDVYLEAVHNNPGRIIRSPEEARVLDDLTREAWHGHPHHFVIDNRGTFEEKLDMVKKTFTRILPMPVAKEKERKFLVVRGTPPKNAVVQEITQTYLISCDPNLERRVRMKLEEGAASFRYTEKRPTNIVGTRDENDPSIGSEDYALLLREKDPTTQVVLKDRQTFTYHGRTFEHDVYKSIITSEEVIEIENCGMDEVIEFPPDYVVVEVTGRGEFSNRAIAEGRYPIEEARRMRKEAA